MPELLTASHKTGGSPLCNIDSISIHFGGLRFVLLHNASKDAAGII